MAKLSKLLILTGDASADLHARYLIQAFQEEAPDIDIHAVGGPEIASTGITRIADHEKLGVLGAGMSLFKSIPYHKQLGQTILKHIETWQPDAVVFIDYGGFHMWLAKQISKRFPPPSNIKRFYYIAPQIWASRPWRVKAIKKAIHHVFCIFPFEKPIYDAAGVSATYVGHPLTEEQACAPGWESFCATHQLDPKKWLIGVFPGSRRSEIQTLLVPFLKTLPLLQAQLSYPVQFVIAQAKNIPDTMLEEALQGEQSLLKDVSIHIIKGESQAVLALSRSALLASGTISLEAALYRIPAVIAYNIGRILNALFRRFLLVPYIGLPNILLNSEIMPEFINQHIVPAKLCEALVPLTEDGPIREQALSQLAHIRSELQGENMSDESPSKRVMQGIIEEF